MMPMGRSRRARPRVDEADPGVGEVFRVARGEACAAGARHCSDHCVELIDGSAGKPSGRCDLSVRDRGVAIKGQHAAGKIFYEDGRDGLHQGVAPRTVRKQSDALKDLALNHSGCEQS
jgi:hypothetical protein